jgi:hypothetical protein
VEAKGIGITEKEERKGIEVPDTRKEFGNGRRKKRRIEKKRKKLHGRSVKRREKRGEERNQTKGNRIEAQKKRVDCRMEANAKAAHHRNAHP